MFLFCFLFDLGVVLFVGLLSFKEYVRGTLANGLIRKDFVRENNVRMVGCGGYSEIEGEGDNGR